MTFLFSHKRFIELNNKDPIRRSKLNKRNISYIKKYEKKITISSKHTFTNTITNFLSIH